MGWWLKNLHFGNILRHNLRLLFLCLGSVSFGGHNDFRKSKRSGWWYSFGLDCSYFHLFYRAIVLEVNKGAILRYVDNLVCPLLRINNAPRYPISYLVQMFSLVKNAKKDFTEDLAYAFSHFTHVILMIGSLFAVLQLTDWYSQ